jgi:hypothetical protein
MSLHESFSNVERPRQLTEGEIDDFAAETVFAAAEYHWGDDFRDPELVDFCEDVVQTFRAPDREDYNWSGVEVSLLALHDTTYELDGDDEPIEGSVQHDIGVAVRLSGLRPDVTSKARFKYKFDYTVWEVLAYEFPIDGSTPMMYKNFELRSAEGEKIEVPKYQQWRVRNMGNQGDHVLPQRKAMMLQDRLDVMNLLLCLNIPEGVIRQSGTETLE